jgi:hypothetical protein
MDCSQLIRKDMAAKKQTSSQKLDLVEQEKPINIYHR